MAEVQNTSAIFGMSNRNKNETQSVVKNPDMKNQEGDAVENHREQTGNPQRVAVPMAVLLACVGIVLFVRKRSFR